MREAPASLLNSAYSQVKGKPTSHLKTAPFEKAKEKTMDKCEQSSFWSKYKTPNDPFEKYSLPFLLNLFVIPQNHHSPLPSWPH